MATEEYNAAPEDAQSRANVDFYAAYEKLPSPLSRPYPILKFVYLFYPNNVYSNCSLVR